MKWGFALSYYRYIPYGFKGSAQEALTSLQDRYNPRKTTVNFTGSEGIDVLAFSAAAAMSEYFALGCTLQQFFSSGSLHLQTVGPDGEFHSQFTEKLRGRNFIVGADVPPFQDPEPGLHLAQRLEKQFRFHAADLGGRRRGDRCQPERQEAPWPGW